MENGDEKFEANYDRKMDRCSEMQSCDSLIFIVSLRFEKTIRLLQVLVGVGVGVGLPVRYVYVMQCTVQVVEKCE